ncbi:uncharacterized protein KGF55_002134 [Candida pseudojiufengensis]|uniref:uncharacterized protein n=1 Tax=Candida pseudojiufengensis TaxID=497109 RepID=UPI0022250B86|nr:uncharacterized protein KGF55_002134 [Candida pseudojiufengensis]KAI5964192.1 hypothetical protein KGF55_002134 [Candida pseudojiufengensis]
MIPYRRGASKIRLPRLNTACRTAISNRHLSNQPQVHSQVQSSSTTIPITNTSQIKNGRTQYRPRELNSKLKDISQQIKTTLQSDNLQESKEIFEEGISFLREVQKDERISDRDLYFSFVPLASELLYKLKQDKDNYNVHNLQNLIDLFIKYRIAHQSHFTELAVQLLQSEEEENKFQKLIQLWVQFIEFDKLHGIPYFQLPNTPGQYKFKAFHLPNIVFYNYVLSCSSSNIAYSDNDAVKFTINGKIPLYRDVMHTLKDLNLYQTDQYSKFTSILENDRKNKIDPNSKEMIQRIFRAVDKKQLDNIYLEVAEVCSSRDLKVEEKILVQLMDKYLYFDEYDQVFGMFQNIISSGLSPSIDAWNLVLRAMINPNRFNSASPKQREELMSKFERTLKTITSSGLSYNSGTLSSIITAYATADKFDIAEDYAKKYSALGINNVAKDGILRGLIFNNKIDEAEAKMKEYITDGSEYKPSSGTMNDFLSYYSKRKNYKAMFGINEFMQQNNIEENVASITTMINAYFKYLIEIGKTPNLVDLLNTLKGAKHLNEHSYASVLNGLIQSTNIEAARQLYNVIRKKYPRSAWIQSNMLAGELSFGDISIGEKIFDHYIKNIRNDVQIWNTVIKNLLNRDENLAFKYYLELKNSTQSKPNHYTYYFLLNHFLNKKNKDAIQGILKDLSLNPLNNYGNELPRLLNRINSRIVEVPSSILQQLK